MILACQIRTSAGDRLQRQSSQTTLVCLYVCAHWACLSLLLFLGAHMSGAGMQDGERKHSANDPFTPSNWQVAQGQRDVRRRRARPNDIPERHRRG